MKKRWMSIALIAVLVLVTAVLLPAMAIAQTQEPAADLDIGNVVPLVGSALFVVAAVNGLKKVFGLSGQYLVGVAMLLGMALQVLVYFFADYELFSRVMLGLVYGGSASGLWVISRGSSDPPKA